MDAQELDQIHDGANVERLLERTRLNILIYISFVLVITSSIALAIRVVIYEDFGTATYLAGLLILLFACLGIYLIKTKNLFIGSFAFHLIAFSTMPFRVYQTGGTLSPLILVYVLHCAVAFSVNGKRFGAIVLGWSVFNIIGMIFVSYNFEPTLSPFLSNFLGAGVAALLMLLLLLLPIIFILEEKDILKDRMIRLEKKESAYVIMRRLTHEYGNYLNIALGYIDMVKGKDKDPKAIEKIQNSLKEMDNIMKGLVRISDEGDLVEYLKKAEDEVKILKTFNNDPRHEFRH